MRRRHGIVIVICTHENPEQPLGLSNQHAEIVGPGRYKGKIVSESFWVGYLEIKARCTECRCHFVITILMPVFHHHVTRRKKLQRIVTYRLSVRVDL